MVLNFKKKGIIVAVLVGVVFFGLLISKMNSAKPDDGVKDLTDEQEISDINTPGINNQQQDDFFSEYRIERERVRGKQVEMLQEIINNQSIEKEARQTASLRLVSITEDMEKEMKAENLVKSKGFEECVVIIQPHTTTVIIKSSTLRLDEEQEIKELVSRITQYSEENLCIIARDL
jgi:stage III sporulation protein AH